MEVGGQHHAPVTLLPEKEGWLGPLVDLDGCGKSVLLKERVGLCLSALTWAWHILQLDDVPARSSIPHTFISIFSSL
jgi:hypothetical protein